MKYEIKHRVSGKVLFSLDTESLKLCVEAAVKADANLRDADLQVANLREANLWGANLWDANLWCADLREANLRGADLQDANLRGADLRDADLWGAYLRGANLRGADLREAKLRGADLQDADLRGAKRINPYICTPLLMLHDQVGAIRSYKLVNEKGEGIYNGGLQYEVGAELSVDVANVNVNEQCGAGINIATLDWCMREWRKGYRILIVEHTAADIAAIPTATDGKYRVHRCKVVGEKDLVEIGLVEKTETAT